MEKMQSPAADPIVQNWRKSHHSLCDGMCVEVGSIKGRIAVRHSKGPAETILWYGVVEWRHFVEKVKGS